ncbi:DUF2756 domain-containing protein [Mangrovibacter yixingensis]|uniref:DUF2756 domain-containing protein n=1 Tax=Mangrovibacter yixingensis TaxID=1529639 RepID=UPI001CFF483D|nr:DUF2756 domain-containing protein [Mangrovibacter yixingensis]
MKRYLILALLLPVTAMAVPLNTTNNPNQPGYVNPSQQRVQQEMRTQQMQQKSQLNQAATAQQQQQQQKLRQQLNEAQQRTQQQPR